MTRIFSKTNSALSTALIAGLLAISLHAPADAQYAHFFRDAKLSPEDIDMAKNAAASLYTKSGVQAGDRATWHNPSSTAEGIVEVLEVEADGPCVVLRHLARTGSEPEIRYYARRCQDADGNWVLAAN